MQERTSHEVGSDDQDDDEGDNKVVYYTSEEFFLYKITVDKRTIHHFSRQNELLTGT